MQIQLNYSFKAGDSNQNAEDTRTCAEVPLSEGIIEKPFTVADLWNIQRQKKTLVRRRYYAD